MDISTTYWFSICPVARLIPYSGVAVLVANEQIAIFRLEAETELYAISKYDPLSKAYVLSRGIVGDRQGILKVASPIYKHSFNLVTGECLDDPQIKLPTYPVQLVNGMVEVGILQIRQQAIA
jgi:nitrite reductase (NADH) small subunit